MPRPTAPLALALLLPVLAAGCIQAPAQPEQPASLPAPTANATLPAALPVVQLKVGTTGQYPVNPGFDPAALKVAAGSKVNLTFTNNDPLFGHNWVLEKVDGAKTQTIGEQGCGVAAPCPSTSVTFVAPPAGTYKYYCSIGDHRQRGMEGTLTVA